MSAPAAGAPNASTDILERYRQILTGIKPEYLTQKADDSGKLSNPFLVSGPADTNARRIMIIGREYGGHGWRVPYDGSAGIDIDSYITTALEKHRTFLTCALQKSFRGGSFFNLVNRIAREFGSGGIIYSNLFCFDHGGKDPRRSSHFPLVKRVSKLMLDAQIECFQPDVIIFANGSTSVDVRREFFPITGPGKVCVGVGNPVSPNVPKDHLWQFELHGRYRCFRIHHPSAQSSMAWKARRELVKAIRMALETPCTSG